MDLGSLFTVSGVGVIGGLGIWGIARGMASRATVDRRTDQAQIYAVDQLQRLVHDGELRAARAEERAIDAWRALEEAREQNTQLRVTVEGLQGEIRRLTEKIDDLTEKVQAVNSRRDGT